MFGGDTTLSVVVSLDYDPAADDYVAIFRAPQALTITGAYATTANAVAANTANYFSLSLVNGGTAGTATTALAGSVGGTAGWAALTTKTMTVSNGTMAAGEIAVLYYDEEGTGTFAQVSLQLDYKLGVA